MRVTNVRAFNACYTIIKKAPSQFRALYIKNNKIYATDSYRLMAIKCLTDCKKDELLMIVPEKKLPLKSRDVIIDTNSRVIRYDDDKAIGMEIVECSQFKNIEKFLEEVKKKPTKLYCPMFNPLLLADVCKELNSISVEVKTKGEEEPIEFVLDYGVTLFLMPMRKND